ncbi:tryptophan-rich sensory protein [Candidatus Bathyarchaeota archaeon]|nr:tryptophan-rich sensory protein [Candidatus Bathyarchaeota archaeon]
MVKYSNIVKLIISIFVCQLAGVLGSIFTMPAIPTWYASLRKPAFSPPNWLFAPAWTTLYILMGVSVYLIWSKGLHKPHVKTALAVFLIQLILNAVWSPAFFGLRSPLAGFVIIVILWVAILLTILSFLRISKAAGLLLIPYIAWVSFAAVLNCSILILNP